MSCRWNGTQSPRLLAGRHGEDCPGGECPGCQPCTEPHCRVCARTHVAGTCAECLAETREALIEIARMCHALPAEVKHRGIAGEALMLLGPVADVEARQHVEASYLAGRLPEGWIEAAHGRDCPLLVNEACIGCAGGEFHPLTVLLTWQLVWRDALEHDEAEDNTLATAVDYLDRTMSYMGGFEHVPFEDFARDLRRCASHLEAVLHDGEQVDTGAPCMTCHVPLQREWGRLAAADGWRCPRCREWRSDQDYRLNVADLHRDEATHLTDRDMEIRTGVRAGTVREWARRGHVAKRIASGRTVYAVADVLARVAS
jgi:hypothetical protein